MKLNSKTTKKQKAGKPESKGKSGQISPTHPLPCSPAPLLPLTPSPPLLPSLAAFALPLLIYLLTLPPGITWANHGADAGDLITAACTLGVPHPSGYPTYTLIGWLFCYFPLGSIAWRFNLLSAVGAAGGAWFLFKSVHLLLSSFRSRVSGSEFATRNPKSETASAAALFAAWSLAFTPLVWSQVIITEVYGVNLFFVGLLLWLSLQLRRGQTRYLFLTGFVFGLSLGVHLTNLFLLPMLIYDLRFTIYDSAVVSIVNRKSKIVNLALLGGGLVSGLLVFVYLPLRAGKAPITWGTPNTLFGFWELVSGQIYHRYLFAAPLHLLDDRLLASLRYLTGGIFVVILAGFGLLELWRRAKDLFRLTLLTSSFYVVYALGYNTVDSYVYFLPVFVFIGLWAGVGVWQVGRWAGEQGSRGAGGQGSRWASGQVSGWAGERVGRWAGGKKSHFLTCSPAHLLLILPLLLIPLNVARISLRNDDAAETFWRSALAQAPPDALLLTSQDEHTLILWYARFVLGKRPDVLTVDTRLADYPWHQRDLKNLDPELTNPANLATLFKNGNPYRRPLCLVSAQEDGEAVLTCGTVER